MGIPVLFGDLETSLFLLYKFLIRNMVHNSEAFLVPRRFYHEKPLSRIYVYNLDVGEHHFTESKFLPIFSSETSLKSLQLGQWLQWCNWTILYWSLKLI